MAEPPSPHRVARGSIVAALASWRTASVVLLAFASGLPLGVVWIAIPDWLRSAGVDIRLVGLVTLAQAPWSFKLLWSPLMDRYRLPWLGRRRGFIALSQVALFALTLGLAGVGHRPETPWVVGALALAIALASATQDIAYDAYTVDVLRPEEQGVAVGARTALYRAAMYVAGGLAITAAGRYSWPLVNVGLALLYLPMLAVTWRAPEPSDAPHPPRSLHEALWLPFLGVLGRRRALEILAFVVCYKLADNLAGALLRPFLVDQGYDEIDRGVALATIGLAATIAGTFLGGILTTTLGLGHALWGFGVLQIFSNLGYVLIARAGVARPLMYGATGFESLTSGLGTGAFAVLLLRLTERRFSATQYALFSSLFGLPRILAGPVSGVAVEAMGWEAFFWATMLAGIPGLVLLHRFVPVGVREPSFAPEPPRPFDSLGPAAIAGRGALGSLGGLAVGGLTLATLAALRARRATPGRGFDLAAGALVLLRPPDLAGWIELLGLLAVVIGAGLVTAAVFAARSQPADTAEPPPR